MDVNADDFTSTTEYQKALSEETEYRSSHKKNDGPTSQQKRKHQITYLAHQVKYHSCDKVNPFLKCDEWHPLINIFCPNDNKQILLENFGL